MSVDAETPQTLTRRELAQVLGCHMQTVTKWEREGLPIAERGRKGRPSRYDEAAVRAWLTAREEQAQSLQALDLVQERARKEHWQALLAEQTYRVRERQLLDAADVAKTWGAVVSAIRAKLLAMPTSFADRVHRAAVLNGLPGVEAGLRTAVYDVLRELATVEGPPVDDPPAPAATEMVEASPRAAAPRSARRRAPATKTSAKRKKKVAA